jgi:RNA polymerase sigma-70 factor (ECF subfamily)
VMKSDEDIDIKGGRNISQITYGDVPALDLLYRKFKEPVFILALSILRDYGLAEDAMQETFLKIRENAVSYRGEASPKSWILAITRNLSVNMLRQRGHEEYSPEPLDDVSEKIERDIEGTMEFNKILDQLEEPDRSIVTYRVFLGFRHKEIAEVLGMSAPNVRMRFSNALKKLKKYFEGS